MEDIGLQRAILASLQQHRPPPPARPAPLRPSVQPRRANDIAPTVPRPKPSVAAPQRFVQGKRDTLAREGILPHQSRSSSSPGGAQSGGERLSARNPAGDGRSSDRIFRWTEIASGGRVQQQKPSSSSPPGSVNFLLVCGEEPFAGSVSVAPASSVVALSSDDSVNVHSLRGINAAVNVSVQNLGSRGRYGLCLVGFAASVTSTGANMTVTGLAIHFDPSGDVFVSVESWGITGDGSAEKIAVLERPKQVKMQRDRLAADIRLTRSGTGLLLHTTLAGSAHFFSEGGTNVPVTVSGVDGDANSSGSVVRPTLVAIGTKISVRDLTVLWGESLSAPTAAAGCAQSSSAAKALAVKDQRPLAMPPNSQAAVTFPELAERIENEILDRSPGVAWEDVAGLEDAKRLLNEAVVLPVLVPELFRAQGGIRPWKGVLLYGPPGTGKTLLAKAVATASKLTFFNMSSSTLLMKHFGESEKMVKTLFQVARHYSPSVVFFDEIDALMGSRGDTGDSGGGSAEVMRRVRAEMLSQIDGLHDGNAESRVVVIATTNCPWDVDEAMRRRLEKRIYVPLPDAATRTNMIRQCCKSAEIDNSVDYAAVSAQCEGLSGADISVLCREALMGPVRRLISGRSPAELASMNQRGEMKVQAVLAEDFEAALQRIHSSVGSISRFEEWHAQFGSN